MRVAVLDAAAAPTPLRSQLAGQGFDVLAAAGLAELVATAEGGRPPEVVLVDVEGDGVDAGPLLAALAAEAGLGPVPVVLVATGVADAAARLAAAPHDWLRRPFEPTELASRVRAAARTARLAEELRRLSLQAHALSLTDPLTGLGNRRHVEEHLEMAASAARRQHLPLSVLVLDVDYLRRVNDSAGRAAGDEVLRRTAARLSGMLRTHDVAGRWGGGELLVVLPATDLDGAWVLAERIRLAVCNEPVALPGGSEIVVTVSIGCASGQGDDPSGHVRRAEAALAEAKLAGRNRVVADTTREA